MFLSIIVPVYNVEKYIKRCLDSIEEQNNSDFEAILIDDGSTDLSGTICDQYAAKDKRFCVIHQENKGLSAARNTGMRVAQGEYICFFDSDDYWNTDVVQTLWHTVESNRVDCVAFNGLREKQNSSEEIIHHESILSTISGLDYAVSMIKSRNLWVSACLYCYKRDVLVHNGIFFKEGILSEDEHFTPRALIACKTLIYLNKYLYHYIEREDSIMTTVSKEKILRRLRNVIDTIYYLENFYTEKVLDSRGVILKDYLARQYMACCADIRKYEKWKVDKAFLKRNCKLKKTKLKKILLTMSPSLYRRLKG